jgi:hypothetical protein
MLQDGETFVVRPDMQPPAAIGWPYSGSEA